MAKLIIVVLALILNACGTPKIDIKIEDLSVKYREIPQTYTATENDNLFLIAKKYNLDYEELGKINEIPSPYKLLTGQEIKLSKNATIKTPTNNKDLTTNLTTTLIEPKNLKTLAKVVTKPILKNTNILDNIKPKTRTVYKIKWQSPMDGKVSKKFIKQPENYQGIDIATKLNTPIYAAADGIVSYSGKDALDKYGLLIIINHNDEALSAYAHLNKSLITEGEEVSRGQLIAHSGKSGTNKPKFHFEIRKDGFAKDPEKILP